MIASDQPTIFPRSVIAGVSSINDGNMRFNRGDDAETLKNRELFFETLGISLPQTTLVQVVYDDTSYLRYDIADDSMCGMGMKNPECAIVADALLTNTPGHALFLPLADCAGAVLYDQDAQLLMVSHLGRHSVEGQGAAKSVEYMISHGATPENIVVWVSPAVGKETYPLHACEGRSLHEEILRQFAQVGVLQNHIELSTIDTAHSKHYYSHSQFKAGKQQFDGRHAIVAMMK